MLTLNSTPPQVNQDMQWLTISFTVNETLLNVNPVRVKFSSNCTNSEVFVSYTNPVLITIPNIRLNTGQCNYSIQLVSGNSQQIGYAITGLFHSGLHYKFTESRKLIRSHSQSVHNY